MLSLLLKNWILAGTPGFLKPYWQKLESSPLGWRLARGAFWSLLGAAVSRVLGLLSSVLVARMLGKANYGQLGIVQSTVGMFGAFAGFGMGLTATKYIAELRSKDPARAGRIIGLCSIIAWITGGIMTGTLLILAPWLAKHTLADSHLGGLLQMSSPLLLLGAVNGAQTGAISGFEAFKRIAHINLITGLATFPLMVVGVWIFDVRGAVGALILSQLLNSALNYATLRSEARHTGIPLGYARAAEELAVVWSFSIPAVLSGVLVTPIYWICNSLLVNQHNGYEQMGLFNAANQWFSALLFLPGVLGQAILPMLAQEMNGPDGSNSRKIMRLSIKLNSAIAIPLVILASFASPYIMAAYGHGFEKAWPTLIAVLLTAGLVAVQSPVAQVISASGRMWLGSIMNLGWAVCFLILTWLLLKWGALGLSVARLGAYVAHGIWTFAFALSLIRERRRLDSD